MDFLPSTPHTATQIVTMHEAKTHLSRLTDDAKVDEAILLAKLGNSSTR